MIDYVLRLSSFNLVFRTKKKWKKNVIVTYKEIHKQLKTNSFILIGKYKMLKSYYTIVNMHDTNARYFFKKSGK